MSVMARGDGGQWRMVLDVGEAPPGVLAELLGDDVAPLFELEESAVVVASMPELPGQPDAICVTPRGELVFVAAVGDDPAEEVRARLRGMLQALTGRSLPHFMAACNRIGIDHTPGSWVASRVGSGDAVAIDRRLDRVLADGAMSFLLVTRCGIEHAALPAAELQARGIEVRCFDMAYLSAGPVRIAEVYEYTRAELEAAARAAELTANCDEMVEACRRQLGERSVVLVDTMLRYCDAFFSEVTFRSVGELVVVDAWLDRAETRRAVLQLDSTGALQVHLGDLDPVERDYFLAAVAGMVDEEDGVASATFGQMLRLSLVDDLCDVSLVEQFVGALSDALLATMCMRMAPVPAAERRMAS